MPLRRKIIIALVVALVGFVAYFVYAFIYTWSHIPEAYAAWDTGTLLVEFMKTHDRKWPASWDDLLSVVWSDGDRRITLYGASAGDTNYARSLSKRVAIDWKFDPTHAMRGNPVKRLDGSGFPIFWAGAEPNEMVRGYLKASAKTNEFKSR
jgi:hypothetical protein